MNHILLVEDDKRIIENLTEYLKSEGFTTKIADGQADALRILKQEKFDLVLLDISLREGNGYETCKAIKNTYTLPVIFLTASGDENSIVTGFEIGADDYIAKPFKPRELLSRIRNALRRYGGGSSILTAGKVSLDAEKGIVWKNEVEISLSALEYRILLFLLSNKGILLTRERLLEEVWDIAGDFVNDNTLTVYIKRIREKIEDDPANPEVIKTVRGIGYRVG